MGASSILSGGFCCTVLRCCTICEFARVFNLWFVQDYLLGTSANEWQAGT
jgi:hypothetical protein